jgi:hypothetical protein
VPAAALPLLSDETADAPDEGALAPDKAPALPDAALPDAPANASGTAKSSDTKITDRNNLFIIIPPKTLIDFY